MIKDDTCIYFSTCFFMWRNPEVDFLVVLPRWDMLISPWVMLICVFGFRWLHAIMGVGLAPVIPWQSLDKHNNVRGMVAKLRGCVAKLGGWVAKSGG
jgi:hypothetical protein